MAVYLMWELFYLLQIDVAVMHKKEKISFVLLVGCGVCSAVCPRGVKIKMTRLQAESILMRFYRK
jgi:ferredoxin